MAGPIKPHFSRRSWRSHQLRDMTRDVGHRLLVTVVVVFALGLLLRVGLG
jgi:hypothetical protein